MIYTKNYYGLANFQQKVEVDEFLTHSTRDLNPCYQHKKDRCINQSATNSRELYEGGVTIGVEVGDSWPSG